MQVPRISGKPKTSLEKLLSVFEQQYFIDEYQTRKEYEYSIDDENIKKMLEVLKHAAADDKTRREMEEAWFADRAEKDYEDLEKEFLEKSKLLEESKRTIEDKERTIEESKKTIENKDKTIEDKERTIEESKKTIEESKRTIEDKDKEIEELRKMLSNLSATGY